MIYFATQENKYVKVGYAEKNPIDRIKSLQTGNPHKLALWFCIQGTQEQERRLHQAFNCVRKYGEWFELTDGLREVVLELLAKYNGDVETFLYDMPWIEGGRKAYTDYLSNTQG